MRKLVQPFSSAMCSLAVLLAAAALAAAAPAPPFPGYIVTAQYKCDDLMCPDW